MNALYMLCLMLGSGLLPGSTTAEALTDTIPRDRKLVTAEYRINSGVAVPVAMSGAASETTFSIPQSLTTGDTVRIRFRSSSGRWSGERTCVVRIPRSTAGNTLLDGTYRINRGDWVTIPPPFGSPFTPPGFGTGDTLEVRFLSSNGQWSPLSALMYTIPSPTSENRLTEVEWQVNSSQPVTTMITPPVWQDAGRTIPHPPLADGDTLKVRYRSWNGIWSAPRRLVKAPPYGIPAPRITQFEWFIDSIPASGTGYASSVSPPSSNPPPIPVLDPLLTSARIFFARFRSENGQWGAPRSIRLHTPLPLLAPLVLTDGEYFRGSDPGEGRGIPLPPPFGGTSLTKTFTIPDTPGGQVFVRWLNNNSKWGHPHPVVNTYAAHFQVGWNLAAIPLKPLVPDADSLFPRRAGGPFRFSPDAGYLLQDTVTPGMGFWIKFNAPDTTRLLGISTDAETVHVREGWNIIGGPNAVVPVTGVQSNPDTIVGSLFYAYEGGYHTDSLIRPGKGYWVKIRHAGVLYIGGTGATQPAIRMTPDPTHADEDLLLRFEDAGQRTQSLRLSRGAIGHPFSQELPPLPPEGGFDIRFLSGRGCATAQADSGNGIPFSIRGAVFPVRMTLQGPGLNGILGVMAGQRLLVPNAGGIVIIPGPAPSYGLRVRPEQSLPTEWALHPNFPNPFNPRTMIRYDVPSASRVSLHVYDLLGRQVAQLVDGVQQAGFLSVEWNAEGLASGVYLCRMEAGGQVHTRKMMLVK